MGADEDNNKKLTTFSGPEDTYKLLVEESKENWLYGLVAFAIVEEQRIEWMKHYQNNHTGTPTPENIRNWYQQQPYSVLLRAKGTAENALQAYSADVLDIAMEDQRREVEESIVVAEIRALKSFWPQFGVNLAGGFVSALLFAVLLTLVAFFVLNDTSPVQIGQKLRTGMEVITHD